jgi:hypothetical protein
LIGLPVIIGLMEFIGLLESPLVALYPGDIPLCTLDIAENTIFAFELESIVLPEEFEHDAAEVNRVAVADIAVMDSEIGELEWTAALHPEGGSRFDDDSFEAVSLGMVS